MKVRTRIVAMLLTVLTVIGLLPFSLFALDKKEAVTEAVADKKSYQNVIAALPTTTDTNRKFGYVSRVFYLK